METSAAATLIILAYFKYYENTLNTLKARLGPARNYFPKNMLVLDLENQTVLFVNEA